MKTLKYFATVTTFTIASLFSLHACKEHGGIIQPSSNKFDIEDFKKQENFWSYSAVDDMIKEGKLGSVPENAFVPLIFNENGILVTAEEYNNQTYSNLQYFATDLATFYEVTKEATAQPDYALTLGNNNDKAVFAYDPYAKEKLSRQEEAEKMLKLSSNTPLISDESIPFARTERTVTNFNAGDFIVRPNSSNLHGTSPLPPNSTNTTTAGHAVGVTQGLLSSTNITTLLTNTWIMEAAGYAAMGHAGSTVCELRETKACVAGNSNSCTNSPIQNNDEWCKDNLTRNRFRLRGNTTATQKTSIVSFMRQQDHDTYSITASKRFKCPYTPPKPCYGVGCVAPPPRPTCSTSSWADGSTWYCSLLVWQAYLFATGTDIDSNGGALVYPNDVINSSTFSNTKSNPERIIRF